LNAQSVRGGLTCIVGIFRGVLPAIASGSGERVRRAGQASGSTFFRGRLLQFIEAMIIAIDVPQWHYFMIRGFFYLSYYFIKNQMDMSASLVAR